ncbi:extradiol dioxygenase [Arenibacter sp. F26102]|uniref:VOC family protein n=1 Tax=Arenibacter sp. F26102 TaxID=2926416 RepID=UPI001FF6BDDC|nr:extradiol dioxygenase [Arenibacter sp. F26102]MCK0145920.1 extradiol dioxygenase [Arenibacter sp. F26102]
MKINQFWLNLPVRDLEKSKMFFKSIGFTPNPVHTAATHLGSFLIGENKFVMMLFPETVFKGFTGNEISNTSKGTEVLLNIDAQSRMDVGMMADLVRKAGGKIYAEPREPEGWMYVCGFEDLDGHRWCMLHMDMKNMPMPEP